MEEMSLSDSILTSVKKYLGPDEYYTVFDQDIVMNINAAFSTLDQVGLTFQTSFMVVDEEQTWDDYFNAIVTSDDIWLNEMNREIVRQYVYISVRIVFDPPTSSFVLTSLENRLKELEWRINVLSCKKDVSIL